MKRWALAFIGLVLPVVASGQAIQTKVVVGSGGGFSGSGTTTLSSIIGEAVTGLSLGPAIYLYSGFQGPLLTHVADVDDSPQVKFESFLGRLSPNPSQGPMTISFGNSTRQVVQLEVHDVAGRLVRTLHRGELQAGVFSRSWDLRSEVGARVGPGMYFVRLTMPGLQQTKRTVVVR